MLALSAAFKGNKCYMIAYRRLWEDINLLPKFTEIYHYESKTNEFLNINPIKLIVYENDADFLKENSVKEKDFKLDKLTKKY